MARLLASIDDDRNPYTRGRGRWIGGAYQRVPPTPAAIRCHRLADQWSQVAVQTWDIKVSIRMLADGGFLVVAEDLVTKEQKPLTAGSLETTFNRIPPKRTATGKLLTPKVKPPRQLVLGLRKPRKKVTAEERRQRKLAKQVDQLFGVSA